MCIPIFSLSSSLPFSSLHTITVTLTKYKTKEQDEKQAKETKNENVAWFPAAFSPVWFSQINRNTDNKTKAEKLYLFSTIQLHSSLRSQRNKPTKKQEAKTFACLPAAFITLQPRIMKPQKTEKKCLPFSNFHSILYTLEELK